MRSSEGSIQSCSKSARFYLNSVFRPLRLHRCIHLCRQAPEFSVPLREESEEATHTTAPPSSARKRISQLFRSFSKLFEATMPLLGLCRPPPVLAAAQSHCAPCCSTSVSRFLVGSGLRTSGGKRWKARSHQQQQARVWTLQLQIPLDLVVRGSFS